jgi:hypothetical protein
MVGFLSNHGIKNKTAHLLLLRLMINLLKCLCRMSGRSSGMHALVHNVAGNAEDVVDYLIHIRSLGMHLF